MANAYVLLHTLAGQAPDIRRSVETIPAVVEADETEGPYDLVLRVDVAHTHDLVTLVNDRICGMTGVVRALPCPSSEYVRAVAEEHFAATFAAPGARRAP
jgi:hypothetical protein